MIKILKTDFFRLVRTGWFYVFPVFVVILLILECIFTISIDDSENILAFGIDSFFTCLYSGLLLLFLGFMLVVFYTNESRDGFLKNAAGCVPHRYYMTISNILVGIASLFIYVIEYAVIRFATLFIYSLLADRPMEYIPLAAGTAGRYTLFVLLTIFVNISMITILVLLHELAHSKVLGMIMVFLTASFLLERIIRLVMSLVKSTFNIVPGFEIGNYLLFSNIGDGFMSESYHPSIVLILCLIYTAGASYLAIRTCLAKDIR